ncbi:MAG: GNAT family N-acetyltransferase [Bacillota bacterium]
MSIELRPIKEDDCDLLFEWVNDESVRRNAFNTNIISYEDHKKWFYEKLCSGLSFIYICCAEGEPVGQIRIDVEEDTGIISYSVAKQHRGKGYGTTILKEVLNLVEANDIKVCKLVGRVKHTNTPSQKAFEKAGYERMENKDCIEYYRTIQGYLKRGEVNERHNRG